MTIIIIPAKTFRALASEYGPIDNYKKIMYDMYGLRRVAINAQDITFEIVDESKYLFYRLKWE